MSALWLTRLLGTLKSTFRIGASAASSSTLTTTGITAARTHTLPNRSGTIALLTDVGSTARYLVAAGENVFVPSGHTMLLCHTMDLDGDVDLEGDLEDVTPQPGVFIHGFPPTLNYPAINANETSPGVYALEVFVPTGKLP